MTTDLSEADSLIASISCYKRETTGCVQPSLASPYYHGHAAIASGAIGQPLVAYARKNDTIYVPTEYISWAA